MMFRNLLMLSGSMVALQAALKSLAKKLAAGETQALAFDFTDDFWQADTGHYGSAYVLDTTTPANNYDSHPYGLLTYSGPHPKMTMGPTGTLRFGAHNLLTRSQQFGHADWGSDAYVTDNYAIAPDGTTTAARIHNTGATDNVAQTISVIAGMTYEFSFYAKNNGGTTAQYRVYNLSSLSEIIAPTSYFSQINGSTWTKISVPFVAPVGCTQAIVYVSTNNGATEDVLVAQAQVRRTPSDDKYLATTSAVRYDLPYEWSSAGILQGLRPEWTAATNLALYNSDLTNAAWTKSNLTTAKTATGPDGVANSATTCTATAGNATALQAITSGSAGRITAVWLKRRTGTGNIDITQDNGSTWTTQSITSSWARYALSPVTSANPTVGIRVVTSGDAVDVALFYHALGATTSSDIPTLGATVARAADNITLAQSLFPWNAGTGTLKIDGIASTPDTSGSNLQIKPRSGETYIQTMLWVPS